MWRVHSRRDLVDVDPPEDIYAREDIVELFEKERSKEVVMPVMDDWERECECAGTIGSCKCTTLESCEGAK